MSRNSSSEYVDAENGLAWDDVVKMAPRFARKYSEVPNWMRMALGLEGLKGSKPSAVLPVELEGILEKAKNCRENHLEFRHVQHI